MTEVQLKEAFRESYTLSFESIRIIPESSFSDEFERKMNKLITARRNPLWNYVNSAAKKAAAIFIGIIIIGAAGMSVKAVRDPVIQFVKTIYEKFISVTFDGDTTDMIQTVYKITSIPDGFHLSEKEISDSKVYYSFNDKNGVAITFAQHTSEYGQLTFDNENSVSNEIQIDDLSVTIITNTKDKNFKYAFWENEGYIFELTCFAELTENEFIEIIRSVDVIE